MSHMIILERSIITRAVLCIALFLWAFAAYFWFGQVLRSPDIST